MRKHYLLPFLLLTTTTQAQQTSVLFIGNSYVGVNDLPNTFRQVALSLGDTVTTAAQTPGGYSLNQHATTPATINAIESQPWDFVVMQEQSQLGALPPEVTDTEIGALQLVAVIEENDECTYPVFYMTWGRQNGDDLNCPDFPYMCTYDGMQQGLRDNYVALGEANDAYVSPVGVAWKQVRDTHPLINLYNPDGSHPSVEGTYLAACVFYCTLFQQSCTGASFVSSVQPDTAAILQGIASAVVLDSMTTWNLDVPNGTDATIDGYSSDGPNDITYYHFGEGTHVWTCTNGQSSTEASPTFTFTTSGTYSFTHTYTDPCGNTDSVTWELDVTIVGVPEAGSASPYRVWSSGTGSIDVSGGSGDATFTVMDRLGRMVGTQRLVDGRARIPCETGLMVYRIANNAGTVSTGKVLVE